MAKTFTDLFAGCGGVARGLIDAGFEPCESVEFDPQIAEIHKANIGGKMHVMNILDCDPYRFEKPDILHASPVCFPANTLILTEKGLKPIQDIETGDLVVTHQSRLRRVTNILSREAQVLELKGQGHYGLITTHDHPFLSVEKKTIYPPHKERKAGNWCHSVLSEPQWVEASQLKGKHWLSLTQYPPAPIPEMVYLGNEGLRGQIFSFSPSFFKVVGLWVGNGWVRYSEGSCNLKNRGEVTISCNKKKVDAMRQDLIDAGIKFHETVKRTAINFSINSRPFCRWLVENFGKLAHGKKIPLWLLGASSEIRSSFFDGYLATDGCVSKRNGVPIGYATTSVSKELAFGIRMLGLTLDYSVTLLKHFPNPKGLIEGRIVNQSPIHVLKFIKSEKLSFVSTIYRSGCVRGVTLLPESQQVFCLTVDEDESFIADGLVVHNCKQFSTANANKGEAQLDIDCARKVAEFIQVLQPKHFTLENVEAYRKSKSFHSIVEILHKLGYFCNWQVLNAADFGVPQSRRRLILIAVKDGFIPSLPPKEKHIGWYEAIKDKVHDLPDSDLAAWQWEALPKDILDHLLVSPKKDGFHYTETRIERPVTRSASELSPCLLADMPLKAILLENTGARSDRELQTRAADEPCWTLRAMGQDGHYHRANALLIHPTDQRTMPVIDAVDPAFTLTSNQGENIKALLENAKIKALDIACLAALQSFPPDYIWSGVKSVDGKGIGNSCCPLKIEKIARSVLL
jgi:site-specific DNA-cytosine methylase